MKSYADVLNECLDATRAGLDVQRIVDAYPSYADGLREDLELAADARILATALPATAPERRHQYAARLRTQVQAAGRAATHRSSGARLSRWFYRPMFAGLAVAGVLIVILALGPLSNSSPFGGQADAATLEGIVLDYADGVLTLQTEKGVESVQVEDGVDIQGAPVAGEEAASFTAGQLVQVKARRTPQDVLRATVIIRRHGEELALWCSRHPVECALAEKEQQRLAGICDQDLPACRLLQRQLNDLSNQRQLGERFLALKDRCQAREAIACRELARICSQHELLCQGLPARLRGEVPPR